MHLLYFVIRIWPRTDLNSQTYWLNLFRIVGLLANCKSSIMQKTLEHNPTIHILTLSEDLWSRVGLGLRIYDRHYSLAEEQSWKCTQFEIEILNEVNIPAAGYDRKPEITSHFPRRNASYNRAKLRCYLCFKCSVVVHADKTGGHLLIYS